MAKLIKNLKQLGFRDGKKDYPFALWRDIIRSNKLSNSFIQKYKEYLDVDLVLHTQKHINVTTVIELLTNRRHT